MFSDRFACGGGVRVSADALKPWTVSEVDLDCGEATHNGVPGELPVAAHLGYELGEIVQGYVLAVFR